MTKAAALALTLLACSRGAPRVPVAVTPPAQTPPAVAPTTLRLVRLPQPDELRVVERTPEATRVVWAGHRAELRGDGIVWAELVGGAPICEVARDGARWVFLVEGDALFASGSFLGAWTQLATPSPLHGASGPRRVGSFVGPALFRDGRARVWRVHDDAVRPIALPWPAHVLALRFDTPLHGVVAVDGPRWLFTHDGGATWRLGRAPANCIDFLDNVSWSPTVHVAPPPGSDLLRCVTSERDATPDTTLLRRRLAFDLAARDPAYLPLVEPFLLEAGTLAAFDGTHLRRYDAASWHERDRVPTTWPSDLRIRGRLPDGLYGTTRDDRALRLRANGGSSRLRPRDTGATLALRADRTASGQAVTGLRCDQTWRTLGDAETDLSRPCGPHHRAILLGDDAVELDASTPPAIRAWPLATGAVDRTLFQARSIWALGATLDGRWLYALGGDSDGAPVELGWGNAMAPWEVVAMPEGASAVAFASPRLVFAVSQTGHLWRRGAGGEGWTSLPVTLPSAWVMEHLEHQPELFCTEAYCQVTDGFVVVDPMGAAPAASPAPARSVVPPPRPGRSYTCARDARLAAAVRDELSSPSGFAWVDEPPGATARHRVNWLGVDEHGVFTGRGPFTVGLAFAGRGVKLVAVSRAGVVAASVGVVDEGTTIVFEGSAGETRPTRAVAVDRWDDWLHVGVCDFSVENRTNGWVTPHPRDGSARVPWRTAAASLRDAPLWLFSRGGVCGVAVGRADEDALTVHELLPDDASAPRRASRPAFESARPCTATAAPDATRWRMEASDELAPLHLGADSVVAEYESSGGAVCLRRASVVEPSGRVARVLAAQVGGTLAGVELVGDTAWSVRCDPR